MHNAALKLESATPNLEYATMVRRLDDGRLELLTSFGLVAAERAVSCLVAPKTGDTVLACVDVTGRAFVLSVLRSLAGSAVDLELDGPASLRASGGLTIAAEGELTLGGGEKLSLASPELALSAGRATADIEKARYTGRKLSLTLCAIKTVARTCESVFERLTQRLGDSFRYVRDLDETQAGSKRVLAEDMLTLHAKNSMIVAEEHVTVNAEQINLG